MEEELFVLLEVGKLYKPLLRARPDLRGTDGALLEQLSDGSLVSVIMLSGMTDEEAETLRDKKISVRLFQEADMLLTLFRFDGTDLVFELSFDPTLYRDNQRILGYLESSNIMLIVGVDSNDFTIKTLRQTSIPLSLYRIWALTWVKNLAEPGFSRRYAAWLRDLENRYSVMQLWDRSEFIGRMGQREDIV